MRSGAGLKCNAGATRTCRIVRLKQRVNARGAGEMFRCPFARRLEATSLDFHYRNSSALIATNQENALVSLISIRKC